MTGRMDERELGALPEFESAKAASAAFTTAEPSTQEVVRDASLKKTKILENQSIFSSNAERPGMTATQALQNTILDQFGSERQTLDIYRRWLKENEELRPSLDNAFGLAMTPQEKAHNWVRSTVETALLTKEMLSRRKQGKRSDEIKQKCFEASAKSEKLWKKIGVTTDDDVIFNSQTKDVGVLTTKKQPSTLVDRFLNSDDPHIIPTDLLPLGFRLKLGSSAAVMAVTQLMTACSSSIVTPAVSTIGEELDFSAATETSPTRIPTEVITPTAAITVEPTVYHVEAAGGVYTEMQKSLNVSQSAIDQQNRIQRWLDYWVSFDNRPFAPNTSEIHWKYIYDNPENPNEVHVLIEAGDEYKDRLFTSPLGGDGFAEFPPPIEGDYIQPGFGPLELTSGVEGQWLSVENGIPVRRVLNGKVVERLNMDTGQWERAIATYVRVTSPDQEDQMSEITLEDVQNGNVAEWVLSDPESKMPITVNPGNIDIRVGTTFATGLYERKMESTNYDLIRNTLFFGILKIKTDQFGLTGKNDAYDVIYIEEGKDGKKVVFQYIMGKGGLEIMKKRGFFSDPKGPRVSAYDGMDSSLAVANLFAGTPQGPDDLRGLGNGKKFYEAQGTSQQEIRDLFQRIADTDTFSISDTEFIQSTIFIGVPNSASSSD